MRCFVMFVTAVRISFLMNQLDSADVYLGRYAALFGRACRKERQKIEFVSYVELSHVSNLMHTLKIN